MLTTLKPFNVSFNGSSSRRKEKSWGMALWTRLLSLVLLSLVVCLPVQAAEVFKTSFFTVELSDGWAVQGKPQNSERALNVNFINDIRNIRINVVVGAAKITVEEQLIQMQKAIRSQGGLVHQLRKRNNLQYFTFVLGQWPGFCYVGSNGKDLAIITAIGNRNLAAQFIRSFTQRDQSLFPSF